MSDDQQDKCADKIAYESPDEARAADAASSFRYEKPKLKVYLCRHCKLYHLTNRSHDDE